MYERDCKGRKWDPEIRKTYPDYDNFYCVVDMNISFVLMLLQVNHFRA